MTSALSVDRLFDVSGLNVLITGGSGGVGLLMTMAFVENGANVFLTSRNIDNCKRIAAELSKGRRGTCRAVGGGSLSDLDTHKVLVRELDEAVGDVGLHVLVNNSGTSWGAAIDDHSVGGWDKVFNLNVRALFFLTQALLPLLERAASERQPARVINVGSVAGLRPQAFPTSAYDASKAAVHHLTRQLAMHLAKRHITVNAIALGLVRSKMTAQLDKYVPLDELERQVPLGRGGSAEDVGGTCVWLASRAGAWITGTVVTCDGGHMVSAKLVSDRLSTSLFVTDEKTIST